MIGVLGLTHGDELFFRPREGWEELLGRLGFRVETRRSFSGLLNPSILMLADKSPCE